MIYLPLANLLHHKLRSVFNILGIGIGICMLLTLAGLARGSLHEIADRWEAVDAGLVLYPKHSDLATLTGHGISDKWPEILTREHADLVRRATPVFFCSMKLGGQDQVAACVDRGDFGVLTKGFDIIEGRLFAPKLSWDALERKIEQRDEAEGGSTGITEKDLAENGWLELVIDTRLARAGGYRLGQEATAAGHCWTIVGIVEEGVLKRVFAPRRSAQFILSSPGWSSVVFLKTAPGVSAAGAVRKLADKNVLPIAEQRKVLLEKFGILFHYVDAVNAVALVIAFLFIMDTLYAMVLQRTRDIAILKASGASSAFIVRQILGESILLTSAGAVAGIAMSFAAAWGIETFRPLLTVRITWEWIVAGLGLALAGAVLSALYPAWRATRVDMLEALTYD